MSILGLVVTALATYYAYQWGSGQKEQPHGLVVFCVMIVSVFFTVPAYYIGKHNRKDA